MGHFVVNCHGLSNVHNIEQKEIYHISFFATISLALLITHLALALSSRYAWLPFSAINPSTYSQKPMFRIAFSTEAQQTMLLASKTPEDPDSV